MKILVVGDIHGRFSSFDATILTNSADLVICTGEFGYWHDCLDKIRSIRGNCGPIWWIDGNHEDFDLLKRRKSDEVTPNVFYKPRGTVETINGKTLLFLGGGFSIDYRVRTAGYDYFPYDELLTEKDLENIPSIKKIDYVFSHTAPREFDIIEEFPDRRFYDSSRDRLSEVLRKYKPRYWFFSHFHVYKTGIYQYGNRQRFCDWVCLNYINRPGFVQYIEI